jgi:hypothetical protein
MALCNRVDQPVDLPVELTEPTLEPYALLIPLRR